MRVASFAGVSGQDGWHLARQLLAEGPMLWGATHDGHPPADLPAILPVAVPDIRDGAAAEPALAQVRPDAPSHLAAISSVEAGWSDPARAGEISGIATARLLGAGGRVSPQTRVSSSRLSPSVLSRKIACLVGPMVDAELAAALAANPAGAVR